MRWLLPVLVFAVAAIVLAVLLASGDERPTFSVGGLRPGASDPFAWSSDREAELVARATAGHSHVLYEKSPEGVFATAARVAHWRGQVESTAAAAGVDPDLLEGMILLESAGRSGVTASNDLEGAVGLTQILAETATGLLGMRVDVTASERLTKRIRRAERRGEVERALRLRAERRRVDERFDPAKALAGTGRYLKTALDRFGREDLAVVSYHMGIGNLEQALDAYGDADVSYAQLYFDSTPLDHAKSQRILASFGDDSSTYLWRVLAAEEIMRLYRIDQAQLQRLDELQTAKASAEEVLHPRDETTVYGSPDALDDAYVAGQLRPFPNRPRLLALRRDRRMGELAKRIDAEPSLYRGLRPEAYALAVYVGAGVREIADTRAPLIVTSTVRDQTYQDVLARRNIQATHAYSLHTTGFAFDVERRYRSRAQAVAFQYLLDRLQSLNLIAWVREPDAIHITVSSDARRLEPLLR
ncbi:MAG TPA: transglycosylase SLT domain-containing protein [Thermoleophilaceae bacterium]